jgi:hypothetical protein
MKKNSKTKILFLITIIIALFFSSLYAREKSLKRNFMRKIDVAKSDLEKQIDYLNQVMIEESVGAPTLEKLVNLLKVYDVNNTDGPIELIRIGRRGDGGYLVPIPALKASEALLGYGVNDDISFEEDYSLRLDKPSFGFDCSTESVEINNKLTSFIAECLGTDEFLYNPYNSLKVSTFNQQIKKLNLENKPVFIKMDIEGAEYEVFAEILENAENVTSIVMELHLGREIPNQFQKAIELLSNLNKDFYLVNVHGNNCGWESFITKNSKGKIPKMLELTFINKNLVTEAVIAKDQTHPSKLDMPNCNFKKELHFEILLEEK